MVEGDVARGVTAAGPPAAPAIVFLHGTRLCRTAWTPQIADLSDTYRVLAIDLPGHGALADIPFTLATARETVAHVIDDHTTGRAVLVGLSLGGYVAMDVAAARPDLVRGLVLSGATAEPTGSRAIPYRGLAWLLDHVDGLPFEAVNSWFFRTRFPAAIAEPIVAGGFWPSGGAQALKALSGERFAERLAAYPGPTLIINGTWDLPFRLSSRSFAHAARDARRVRLAGAAHLANLDRPAAFDKAIRRFMTELDGSP